MRQEKRRDKEFTNRTDTKKLSPNQVQEAHRETKDKRKQGDWKEFLEREIRELTEYGLVFKGFEKLLMLTSNNTNNYWRELNSQDPSCASFHHFWTTIMEKMTANSNKS